MIREGKFGSAEAVSLVSLFVAAEVFLSFQSVVVDRAAQASWLSMLLASAVGLGAFVLITLLMEKYPGRTIIDIGEELAGPVFNTIFSLLYLSFFIALTSLVHRQFSERVVSLFIGEMPISMSVLPFLAGMLGAAYLGLETIARGARLFFWIIVPGYLLVQVLTFPFWEWYYLLPVLGNGLEQVILAGLKGSGFFADLFVLTMIYPALPRDKFRLIGLGSLGISALLLITGTITLQMAFPYPMAVELALPTFDMARLIYFGRFFQRTETLFAAIWILTSLVKMSLGLYVCSTITARMLRLPHHRPLLPAMAVITVALAFAPENISQAVLLDNEILRIAAWSLMLPVVTLLVLTRLRGKGKTPRGKEGKNAPKHNSSGGGPGP